MTKLFLLVLLCISLATPVFAQRDATTFATPIKKHNIYTDIKVIKVFDCATLELQSGEKVRLIGVKCPEAKTKACNKATEFVKDLLGEKDNSVRLEYDVEEKDELGRLLAYVYIDLGLVDVEAREGIYYTFDYGTSVFVNASIIQSGFASPVTSGPNVQHAEVFQELFQEAVLSKQGQWQEREVGKEGCLSLGGAWGIFGELQDKQCNLPTTDKGKPCKNYSDCHGACIADLTDEQWKRAEQGDVLTTDGKCSAWTLNYSCLPFVEGGKVKGILCQD
ncbi:thermonuclease family protein [Candidatus Omnitrophota bacterium]